MHSIDKLLNLFRGQVAGALNSIAQIKTGIISSYNPVTYTAKVRLQPSNQLTDYLPILTPWVGNEWGFFAAPNNGDTVVVLFLEGNPSSGVICLGMNTKINKNIQPGPKAGEAWMVHKTGTFFKFLEDGTIEMKMLDENGDPTILKITGDIEVTGKITATKDILDNSIGEHANSNTIRSMREIYDLHKHPTPAGDTDIPYQQM